MLMFHSALPRHIHTATHYNKKSLELLLYNPSANGRVSLAQLIRYASVLAAVMPKGLSVSKEGM